MKTAIINIRVERDTRQKLDQYIDSLKNKAGRRTLTRSALLRTAVEALASGALTLPAPELAKLNALTEQIRRIGTNLNQLAHAHNAGLITRPINADHTLEALNEQYHECLKIMRTILAEKDKHRAQLRATLERRLRHTQGP